MFLEIKDSDWLNIEKIINIIIIINNASQEIKAGGFAAVSERMGLAGAETINAQTTSRRLPYLARLCRRRLVPGSIVSSTVLGA